MIDPFEYDKTRATTKPLNTVTDGGLDTSALDAPLKKLNHFDKVPDFDRFVVGQKPFTDAHQKRLGRVSNLNHSKSDYQSEAIGQLGSKTSEYEVKGDSTITDRANASVLLSRYLDGAVGFVPKVVDTVESIENLPVSEPVLQPGITFIDSRKNMATTF